MASWIVHLRIVEKLLNKIDILDPPQFAVGNIAPDSGIPDEKWENFNPPGEVTHFMIPNGNPWRCADLDFYRRYLQDIRQQDNIKRFSFLLGYFFHLLADNLWHEKIALPTQVKYAIEFENDSDFVWEVKRDWYGLDFIYVRDHPNSLFYQIFLNCEYVENYLDFMPIEAVQQRISYIKEY
ncbi:MAG: zinc dependent phospholipase C family protein, partial [Candidatus Hodarchaeota archaeon]